MMLLADIFTVLLGSNLILTQALGTSTLFIASGGKRNLVGIASVITVFTTAGSMTAFLINRMLGDSFSELTLFFYTIAVGILYILLLTGLYFISREAFNKYKKYIHISAFNCAVMGTFFTIRENDFLSVEKLGFTDYIACGFESGLGFIAAALILTAAYKRLNSSKVPSAFRGFPAMLVYLGIISMAVYSLK